MPLPSDIQAAMGGSAYQGVQNPAAVVASQPVAPTPSVRHVRPEGTTNNFKSEFFGANLFTGNFRKTREDGLNPNYRVAPGDQISVHTWGSVNINSIFTVDAQGNIFLPEIGPVKVAGVPNKDLSNTVRRSIRKVFIDNFEIYTNVVSTQPVMVYVTGLVKNPGRYGGVPSDSILFYLDLAGGIDEDLGSYRNIELRRYGRLLLQVDLYDFLLRGHIRTPQLQDGDVILVKKRGPVVRLTGDVKRPYSIELKGRATGESLFLVVPPPAEATQVSLIGMRKGSPVTDSMSIKEFRHTQLQNGDEVLLRADGRPNTILVRLEGEFEGASVLPVQRGARLLDVLDNLPANTEAADLSSIHLRRVSVAKQQKDSIAADLFRLERDALLALSQSAGEAGIRKSEAELTQRFVEKARAIDPLGRVVTSQSGIQQNILLEPDDVIVIPVKSNVVRVSGQVTVTQAVTYNKHWVAKDYIRQAGGYSDRAHKGKIILFRPNAEAVVVDATTKVGPGDEIIVPPKVDTKFIQNAGDILDIVYKVAISAKVALDL